MNLLDRSLRELEVVVASVVNAVTMTPLSGHARPGNITRN